MAEGVPIEGKIALVTGGNRGIGKAIVVELLESGAKKVYAGARDTSALSELQEKYGDKLVPVELDVTKDDTIKAAAQTATDVEILVNNAGVLLWGNFSSGNVVEGLEKNFAVNVYGVAKVTDAFLDVLRSKDSAAIVTVSSVAGLANMPMGLTYSVSKAAVHSMIQGLRGELKDTNILVSGVYPGPIDTDMAKGVEMEKESPENVAKNIIAGIQDGTEDIFPDPMAKQVGQGYASSPKAVEQQFADFGG